MTRSHSATTFFDALREFEKRWEDGLPVAARYLFVKLLRKADELGWEVPLSIPNTEAMGWLRLQSRQGLDNVKRALSATKLVSITPGSKAIAPTYLVNLEVLLCTDVSDTPDAYAPNRSDTTDTSTGMSQIQLTHKADVSADESDTVAPIEPNGSSPPTDARAREHIRARRSGLSESVVNYLTLESKTPLHRFDRNPKFGDALRACVEAGVTFSDFRVEQEKAVAKEGGWAEIGSAPGHAARVLSRMVSERANGGGMRAVIDALGTAGPPTMKDVWAYIKQRDEVEMYDDGRAGELQAALVKRWPRTPEMSDVAYEIGRARKSYLRKQETAHAG